MMLSWLSLMFQKEGPDSWSGYPPPTLFLGLLSVWGFFPLNRNSRHGTSWTGHYWGAYLLASVVLRGRGARPWALKIPGCCPVIQSCLTLRPHGLQHPRLPCPPSPGACSNLCPLSRWCRPTISSSVVPFSFCRQSFPASGSFLVSLLFESDGQNIGASISASVPPVNTQDWFPLGLTSLISLQSKSQESSPSPQFKSINSSVLSLQLSHLYMTTGKTIVLTVWTFVNKVMSVTF